MHLSIFPRTRIIDKKSRNEYYIIKKWKTLLVNRLKRFVYANCCKIYNETLYDILVIDETTVEICLASYKNWNKTSNGFLRASSGKIGKPKHSNVKMYLLGGISRKGLTRLILFNTILD